MKTTIRLTLVAEMPDGLQVGDELDIEGKITVQGISADLVDVSQFGDVEYLPGQIEISAYGNHIKATRAERLHA